MKKHLLKFLLALFLFAGWQSSFGQVTITPTAHYESFNYSVGDTIGVQATDWTNLNSGDSIVVSSGSLSYSGLPSSVGNKINFVGGGIDPYLAFTEATSGSVFASFIMKVTDQSAITDLTDGGYFAALANGTTSYDARLWLIPSPDASSSTFKFEFGVSSPTPTTGTYNIGDEILVVMSYSVDDGSTACWINPSSADFGGTAPTATLTSTDGSPNNISKFFLRQDSNGETPAIELDELRIGTSWADVTPKETDPPVWTSTFPKTANIESTALDVVANLDETGTVYYVVLADGATAPTSAQVKAGTDAADGAPIASGNIVIAAATTDYSANVTGLTASTAYDIYVVAEDGLTNIQATPTLVNVTTAAPDVTAPAWEATYPKTANIANNDLDLLVSADEIGTAYYVVLADASSIPNSAQVIAGTDGAGGAGVAAGSISIAAATTEYTKNITGLAAGTTYDIFVVAQDDETVPNVQGTPTEIADVTTTSIKAEPTEHVTGQAIVIDNPTALTLNWTDGAGAITPDGYLILAKDADSFVDPVDLTAQVDDLDLSDGTSIVNIAQGVGTYQWTGLHPNQAYYFQIYSYTNSGASIDYKIDGTIPAANATTPEIVITAPAGGETYYAGDDVTVTWTSTGVTTVDITVYNEYNDTWDNIADDIASDGTEIITIPTDADYSAKYRVAITDINNTTVTDTTTVFTIISTPTINDIQSSTSDGDLSNYDGHIVKSSGIVTAIDGSNYWVQDGDGQWNGILFYDSGNAGSLTVGDSITFVGEVDEYNNLTEMKNISSLTINSGDNTLPSLSVITTNNLDESYEGVLVKIVNAEVTNADAGYGQFEINDGSGALLTDDDIFAYTATANDDITITGIGHYSFSARKLLARSGDDILSASDTITSSVYTVNQGTMTITDVPFVTNLADFKTNIAACDSAAFNVFDADGTTLATILDDTKKIIVTAADGITKSTYTITKIAPKTGKDILTFSFTEQTGAATIGDGTIAIEVSASTVLTNLIATFTYSDGASAAIGATPQVSGTTANDFSSDVTYVVTAEDGTTKNWVVTVTNAVSLSTANDILTYTIGGVNATMNNTDHTVAATLPYGTNVSALVATFTLSASANAKVGAVAQVSGTTANNFTNPVVYDVTAEDGTTVQPWTVTITITPASTDATLSTLTVNNGTLVPVFDAATIAYTVELPFGTTTEPVVAATANDANVISVVINQITDIEGDETARTATVVVTAEDNSTSKTYTIIFSVAAATGDLIISEYVEGSSSNRAIELYNVSGESVDLSAFTIKQSYSGDGWGIRGTTPMIAYVLPLTGTLAAGEVYVIAHADASTEILAEADITFSYSEEQGARVPSFTGDDAIGLFKYDALVDQVGFELESEGVGPWNVGDTTAATQDNTLMRKYGTTAGNTNWASSAGTTNANSEWIIYASDDISNLGSPSVAINAAPVISDITLNPTAPTTADAVTISATITDDATAADALTVALLYGSAEGSETTSVTFTQVGTTSVFEGIIPASAATVYYKITVSDGNLSSEETGNYNVTTTGIKDIVLNSVKLYPNPSNGLVKLELNNVNNEELFVEVYNVIGKLVHKAQITENVTEINLTDMNAGIYYVSVRNNDSKKVTKLMIQ
jgi:hypothetical protein